MDGTLTIAVHDFDAIRAALIEGEYLSGQAGEILIGNELAELLEIGLGDRVHKKENLGEISDPFSPARAKVVRAPYDGMIIGYSNNPLVHQGDALVHIAKIGEVEAPLPSRS